jgi:hypothetical protein
MIELVELQGLVRHEKSSGAEFAPESISPGTWWTFEDLPSLQIAKAHQASSLNRR